MASSIAAQVSQALASIDNPRLGQDLMAAGMIQDLEVNDQSVSFAFLLGRDDPATLVRQARKAVKEVMAEAGMTGDVKINVLDPGATSSSPGAGGPGAANAPAGSVPASGRPGPGPAQEAPPPPAALDHLGRVLAISSGKGGVGKSTVSANLALALAQAGHSVGLLDADIYGPNIPRMFGVDGKPAVMGGKIQPLIGEGGVKLMSLGFLVERDAAAIWRGPIIMKVINQFLNDVDWGQLDYLIVDLPPGTGDAQLSLVQQVAVSGALIVTTPQEVAIGDALRGAKMFERVNVPVIGIVENMSGFVCPSCGDRHEIFLSGGGEKLAGEIGVEVMTQVPLQAGLAQHADAGRPVVLSDPDSPAAGAFQQLAAKVAKSSRKVSLPIINA